MTRLSDAFDVHVATANRCYRLGSFVLAMRGYLKAAGLARRAGERSLETEMLHAAQYCDERGQGRMPKELWS